MSFSQDKKVNLSDAKARIIEYLESKGELTESVKSKKDPIIHEDVLELTKLVSNDDPIVHLENVDNKNLSLEEEDEIRLIVRDSIKNHSSEKIDLIIKQEMKKIIEEKLSKAQVVIDSGDKN